MTEKDVELICRLNKDWRPENIKIKKAGGQTNRNWIVEYTSGDISRRCSKYKNKKFLVRLPWERTDIVNREVEAGNILALTKCKKLAEILPKYYFYLYRDKNILQPKSREVFNLPDGTMMVEYIEGKDIDGKDLQKPKIQKELLKTLHTFHTSGVKFVNIYDVFRDEVLKYKNKAKRYQIKKLISPTKMKEIENIEKVAKGSFSLGGKVSTHNDLIFENLRLGRNRKIYLLDFEYAGFNIRDGLHYDLGIILGGNLFQKNPIKIEVFEEILKRAKEIYREDLNDYKIYCGALTNILVMFWWGVVKYFSSSTKEENKYFKNYVLKRAQGTEFLYDFINKKVKR